MGKIAERFRRKQIKQEYLNNSGDPSNKTLSEILDHINDPAKDPTKGQYMGRCNMTACHTKSRPVDWYNKYTNRFYCESCAWDINRSNRKFKDFDNGEPFVTFKTAEEAEKCYVNPNW